MPKREITHHIHGSVTTGGVAEETLSMSTNGVAAVATTPIAAGSTLTLKSVTASVRAASAPLRVRLQIATDAATFNDFYEFLVGAAGSQHIEFPQPIKIDGGAQVELRVRVTTETAGGVVSVAILGNLND